MFIRVFTSVFFLTLLVFAAAVSTSAQGRSIFSNNGDPYEMEPPKSFRESLAKKRIEKEKKEYDEMVGRADEALKIAEDLESRFAAKGSLMSEEMARLNELEKLARKIRGDLGGDDDKDEKEATADIERLSAGDAMASLKKAAVGLVEEMKKTTRFSISAAAIRSTNSVIRLAKFIRLPN